MAAGEPGFWLPVVDNVRVAGSLVDLLDRRADELESFLATANLASVLQIPALLLHIQLPKYRV